MPGAECLTNYRFWDNDTGDELGGFSSNFYVVAHDGLYLFDCEIVAKSKEEAMQEYSDRWSYLIREMRESLQLPVHK